ncbi:hypothetical protein GCM10009799_30950 [Nocardiopsis rhodophaea]|uniref:Lipoprotein n=1 Tax=Nocardiopsis rhodophaea TaxID=280238 RepID=A0ABN2T965_9ACTN
MKRLLAHSSLVLASVLLMTACQGGGSDEEKDKKEAAPSPVPAAEMEKIDLPDSPDKLAEAVSKRMQEALSVEVAMTVDPEEPEGEDAASIEDVSMTLLLTDPPAARMKVVDNSEDRPSTAHIVVMDKVMYTKLEEEPLLKDKEWMKISRKEVDKLEDEIGPFAEIFRVMLRETNDSLDQASGESSLDVVRLGELSEDPESAKSEDGEPVTRYKGTTSTTDLADAGHDNFKRAVKAGLDEVSWELTVSDKGLPDEFTVELVTPDGEKATSTVHYSNWGAEVEITLPPENNTGTIQESLDSTG